MSDGRKCMRLRTRAVILLLCVLALMAFSCWYVHLPMHTQVRNYSRFSFLVSPIEELGEAVTVWTDGFGITGQDVEVGPGDFKDTDQDTCFAGRPTTSHEVLILENKGFTVAYSEELRNPIWVAYRLPRTEKLSSPPRPARFTTDKRTSVQVNHDDYTSSGYDRGHMAPNYAIATRFGKPGQKDTFLMSNIVPQRPGLNRKVWMELEHRIAREYAQIKREVWVITGPIFDGQREQLESGVAIPDAFFKIVVDVDKETIRVMSFIFLQESTGDEWMRRHLSSVDEIEELTGIDFFPDLPEAAQQQLESRRPTRLWRLGLLHFLFSGSN